MMAGRDGDVGVALGSLPWNDVTVASENSSGLSFAVSQARC